MDQILNVKIEQLTFDQISINALIKNWARKLRISVELRCWSVMHSSGAQYEMLFRYRKNRLVSRSALDLDTLFEAVMRDHQSIAAELMIPKINFNLWEEDSGISRTK